MDSCWLSVRAITEVVKLELNQVVHQLLRPFDGFLLFLAQSHFSHPPDMKKPQRMPELELWWSMLIVDVSQRGAIHHLIDSKISANGAGGCLWPAWRPKDEYHQSVPELAHRSLKTVLPMLNRAAQKI